MPSSAHPNAALPAIHWLPPCPPGPLPPPPAVVLTSSLAAVSADFGDRGPGHVYSEADWNLTFPREAQDAYFT